LASVWRRFGILKDHGTGLRTYAERLIGTIRRDCWPASARSAKLRPCWAKAKLGSAEIVALCRSGARRRRLGCRGGRRAERLSRAPAGPNKRPPAVRNGPRSAAHGATGKVQRIKLHEQTAGVIRIDGASLVYKLITILVAAIYRSFLFPENHLLRAIEGD